MIKRNLMKIAFSLFLFMIVNVNAEVVKVDNADKLLDAVIKGGEIQLIDNINFGEFTGAKVVINAGIEVKIDLNGYTIQGKSSDEKVNAMLIQNNGTLTIDDSSTSESGKITMTDTEVALGAYSVGSYTIKNYGNLIIESGTIENTGKTDVPYPIDNDSTIRNTTVNVNGGIITGNKAGIRGFCNSITNENNIVINDGVITAGNSAIWVSQVNKRANKGYLEVNGGTITAKKYNGVYVSVFDQSVFTNIKLKFTGGTIKNNSETSATLMYEPWAVAADLENAVIDLEITGGTFINENENGRAFVEPAYVNIPVTYTKIMGGIFSTDVRDYIAEGLIAKKVDDLYYVGKENTINIKSSTNGKVSVDKNNAVTREIVTLTLTPDEGYELDNIKVLDVDGKEIKVEDNTFVMPNSNVIIEAIFTKVTITSNLPTVDITKEIEKVTVGVKDKATVENTILDTIANNKDLSDKIKDVSVKIGVEIAPVDTSKVLDEVAKIMKEKAGKATIANYFDISIALKDEKGTINETISELTKEIELMVTLPEELKNTNNEVARNYYIVREHIVDGKSQVDLLETKLSEDGKYLTFKTDKFSTYALAYEDVKVLENPNTGDSLSFYIAIGFISLLAIGISVSTFKKNSSK